MIAIILCTSHQAYGGRAEREGKAFNLVVGKEVLHKLREIQRRKTRIIPQAIPSRTMTSIKADKILDQARYAGQQI